MVSICLAFPTTKVIHEACISLFLKHKLHNSTYIFLYFVFTLIIYFADFSISTYKNKFHSFQICIYFHCMNTPTMSQALTCPIPSCASSPGTAQKFIIGYNRRQCKSPSERGTNISPLPARNRSLLDENKKSIKDMRGEGSGR